MNLAHFANWINGYAPMYLISEGVVVVLDYATYADLPISALPLGSIITPDAMIAEMTVIIQNSERTKWS